jgi:hypothetical protein
VFGVRIDVMKNSIIILANITVLKDLKLCVNMAGYCLTNSVIHSHFTMLFDTSQCLVAPTIVPQLCPHKYCYICGGQNFVSALETDDNDWVTNSKNMVTISVSSLILKLCQVDALSDRHVYL